MLNEKSEEQCLSLLFALKRFKLNSVFPVPKGNQVNETLLVQTHSGSPSTMDRKLLTSTCNYRESLIPNSHSGKFYSIM